LTPHTTLWALALPPLCHCALTMEGYVELGTPNLRNYI